MPFPREYDSCQQLFTDQNTESIWPPPKEIPEDLLDRYTLERKIPIAEWYFGDQKMHQGDKTIWTKQMFYRYMRQLDNQGKVYGSYGPEGISVYHMMKKYNLTGLRVLVQGSQYPWVEAIAVKLNAKEVITVEYGEIKLEWDDPPTTIITYTPSQVYDMVLNGTWDPVDFIVSFSSIEHDGLGRYSDPLNPEGDLISADRLTCLIKENGHLLLGIPMGPDTLVWNAHRIYGQYRLRELTSAWEFVEIYGKSPNPDSLIFRNDQNMLKIKNLSRGQPAMIFKSRGCICKTSISKEFNEINFDL